ncbi:MAG: MFS transporter [Minwuia sp.]|nr:MFS transporter [Minwuia sp.]
MSDPTPTARSGGTSPWDAVGVLLFCFILGMVARGMFDSFVVMLRPLDDSHDWDRDKLTAIYAIAMVCWGAGAPLAGLIFDRFGPRAVYLSGLSLMVSGMLLASMDYGLWSFYLGHGIAVGTAGAMLGNVTHAALVSRWFDKRRAAALGLVHSSMGIGVLAFSPISQILIDELGWQSAYRWLAVIGLCIVLPVVLFAPWKRFLRGDPAIMERSSPNGTKAQGKVQITSLKGAMGTWYFWALGWIYATTGAGIYVAITQQVDYFQTVGIPALDAASLYGITGALAPVGMIGFGFLGDRFGILPAATLSYALTLTAYAGFLSLAVDVNIAVLYGAIICLGLSMGSRGPMISSIASRLFQGPAFGRIYGFMLAAGGTGGGLGAWIGGFIQEASNGYAALYYVGVAVLIVSGVPFIFLARLVAR